MDLDECGTENVVRIYLVDPLFHSSVSWALSNISKMSASVSSGFPNTRPFIVFECLETPMKHKA